MREKKSKEERVLEASALSYITTVGLAHEAKAATTGNTFKYLTKVGIIYSWQVSSNVITMLANGVFWPVRIVLNTMHLGTVVLKIAHRPIRLSCNV